MTLILLNDPNTTIKRLIFATGPWQLIMATSAMRQDHQNANALYEDHLLLVFYQLPDETKQVMLQLAKILWNWDSIVQIDENFLGIFNTNISEIDISNYSKKIKSYININDIDEIWLCLLAGKLEKLLMGSYKSADIIVYEDGLCLFSHKIAYSNYLDDEFGSVPKKLKHQLKNFIYNEKISYKYNNSGLLKNHTNRLKKVYLFLCNTINPPNYLAKILIQKITDKSLLNSIRMINTAIDFTSSFDFYKSSEPMALVLSQCFAKWNRMSWEEELSLYRRVFKRLTQNGITPLWKEHPRADRPFFQALLAEDWPIRPIELNVHYAWPIEILIQQVNIIGCISISSSSLFYLKELFNIPTYTLANEVTLSKHDAEIARLVIDQIPAFSSVF